MEIYIDQRIDCKNLGHTEYQIPGQFELQSQVILYGGLSSLNKIIGKNGQPIYYYYYSKYPVDLSKTISK